MKFATPNSSISIIIDIEASTDIAIDTGIKHIIITGDFELDYLKSNTRKKIDDICNQYSMTQITDEPRHFTETSSSLIDIFNSNNPGNIILSGVREQILSQIIRYHCSIYCFYNLEKEHAINIKRQIWLYDKGNYCTKKQ